MRERAGDSPHPLGGPAAQPAARGNTGQDALGAQGAAEAQLPPRGAAIQRGRVCHVWRERR